MRVLIAGCGDVGSVLATRLKCQGHRVFGLKRDTSTLPAGVEAVQADLTQVVTLTNLPTEIDRLIFMPTPACRNEAGYRDIFINGWTNLWESLEQKPVRTLLVSSTAVFAQSDGSLVNEESQTAPVRFNGRVLLDMERQAAGCTGQLVIVRLSGIYGPGRERLIELAATEGVETQQSPPFFTNRIHRDDAASALMHIMMINQPDKIIEQAEYTKYKPDSHPVKKHPLKHTASTPERQPEDRNHQHPQTYRRGEFEKVRTAKPVG